MAGNDRSSGSDPEMEDESCSGSTGGNEWWKVVNRKRKKTNSQGSFTDSGKEDHASRKNIEEHKVMMKFAESDTMEVKKGGEVKLNEVDENHQYQKGRASRTRAKQSFKCTECGASFTRHEHIRAHMRIHTGEKPFTCPQCDKSFTYKADFRRHIRIHTGEKPFTCHVCEKSFKRKDYLESHMFTHTEEKPFTCHQCEKSFRRKQHLVSHMVTHTEKKPFTCQHCEKCFRRKQHLVIHMLTHAGVNPFT